MGDMRATIGLSEGGEEGEANFTPPVDFDLFRGGGGLIAAVRLVRAMEKWGIPYEKMWKERRRGKVWMKKAICVGLSNL
ncbi:hypothetical protein LIER_11025 [Lithospermum erythrorhizon]|uniref:Uncharacterized protein n=1 Tax=Lithospermum erythrorhizon TaxID=34254 RepID=A0AAV3PNV0_LITER